MRTNQGYRLHALTIALAAIAVLCSAPRHAAAADQPARWALIVGVDRYDNADITQLQFAGADAKAFAQTLQQSGGYAPDHIILMTSDQKGKERPTSANILGWLESLKAAVKPGDEFIFYFSGHGITQDGQGFLLTADTNLGSRLLLAKSALAITEVREALQELRVGKMMQILDACRNDPRGGNGGGDNPLSRGLVRDLKLSARPTNYVPTTNNSDPLTSKEVEVAATMFACEVGERSFEGYQGHGYFTYFLCEGLKGGAADASGQVTIPSLDEYVRRKVLETVKQRESGKEQRPWVELSGGTTWVLAHTKGRGEAPPPVAISPPDAKAVVFSKLYREDDASVGAWRAYFLTSHGEVQVYLPDDVAKGDQVSGVLVQYPPQGTKDEQGRHLEALSQYSLELAGNKVPLTSSYVRWQIPAGPGKPVLHLRDPLGSVVASLPLPVAERPTSSAAGFKFPQVVAFHKFPLEGFQITGPFDGDITTTKVTSNGKELDKLAESPRKLVVLPNDLVMNVQVDKGGHQGQSVIHVVVPNYSADSLSALKVSVVGLKGLESSQFPLTVNIVMTGENEVTFDKNTLARTWPLVIQSSDVKADGTATFAVPIKGGRKGDQIQLTSYLKI